MSVDSSELCDALVIDLAHSEPAIRTAAAEALAAALTDHRTYIPSTLDLVLDLYAEHLKVSIVVNQLPYLFCILRCLYDRLIDWLVAQCRH